MGKTHSYLLSDGFVAQTVNDTKCSGSFIAIETKKEMAGEVK